MTETNAARIYGALSIVGGSIILLLTWLVPGWIHDTVTACNTVAGSYVSTQDVGSGAQCTTVNFLMDYRWIFILIGLGTLVGGLVAFFGANDPEVRDEL